MWRFRSPLMGGEEEEEEEENFLGEGSDGLCSLSPMQRMYGFGGSLAVGLLLMLLRMYGFGGSLAVGLLLMLLSLIAFAKPIKFAVIFTLGNILAVGSTAFLIGPAQQARLMFDPVRVYASAIYIGSVIFALVFALLIHSKLLTVLAIIIEICALIWYGLSYVPFARRIVSDLFLRVCDTEI